MVEKLGEVKTFCAPLIYGESFTFRVSRIDNITKDSKAILC